MMQQMMANIDLFTATRESFHSREAFSVHSTSCHREQSPYPDQLKATHFILKNKFVKPNLERRNVSKFPNESSSVSNSNIDAYNVGRKKVEENFERKLYSAFGILLGTGNDKESDLDDSDHE